MPGVPWKNVKGMRDKVVHDYPEVDLDVMWDTLLYGLPAVGIAIINRAKPLNRLSDTNDSECLADPDAGLR
jgi:uncharacterized protein with HEPN domain